MRRSVIAVIALLAFPAAAQARILPLERAHPDTSGAEWHYGHGVAPLNGITIDSRFIDSAGYPWSQVTIAWNDTNGNVLVGCRGGGVATVRVWTTGHGWKLTTCTGHEPWIIVLRHITPAIHLNEYVTFQEPVLVPEPLALQ